MSKNKMSPLSAAARLWFSVTPRERRLLFGIAALLLLGITLRHFYQRAQTPVSAEAPAGDPRSYGKEPAQ